MKIISFLLILCLGTQLWAETLFLNKGDKAPDSGWLISPKAAEESFRINEKYKLLDDTLKLRINEITKKDEIILLQKDTIQKTEQSLSNIKDQQAAQQSNQTYINLAFLGIGIASTVAVMLVLGFALGAIKRETTTITP